MAIPAPMPVPIFVGVVEGRATLQMKRQLAARSLVFLMTGLPSLKVASSIPQLHFTRGLDPYVGSKGESPLARDGVRHAVDLDAARFPGGDRSKSSTTKVTLALPCLTFLY